MFLGRISHGQPTDVIVSADFWQQILAHEPPYLHHIVISSGCGCCRCLPICFFSSSCSLLCPFWFSRGLFLWTWSLALSFSSFGKIPHSFQSAESLTDTICQCFDSPNSFRVSLSVDYSSIYITRDAIMILNLIVLELCITVRQVYYVWNQIWPLWFWGKALISDKLPYRKLLGYIITSRFNKVYILKFWFLILNSLQVLYKNNSFDIVFFLYICLYLHSPKHISAFPSKGSVSCHRPI